MPATVSVSVPGVIDMQVTPCSRGSVTVTRLPETFAAVRVGPMRTASEGSACIAAGRSIVTGPRPGRPQVISKRSFRVSVAGCDTTAGETTAVADRFPPAAAGAASAAATIAAAAARLTPAV